MINFLRVVCLLVFASPAFSQPIVYVTPSGAGDHSGSSWANALPGTQLPSRVPTATDKTQFWVAAGTYTPTTTTDRTASFSVASGVSIYGGFAGNEMSLTQRVNGTNETVFSGDIGTKGDAQDNSKIVVRLINVSQSITLDDLTIRDGHIISYDNESSGAGLLVDLTNSSLSLSITNCRFINNLIVPSYSGGGAIGFTTRTNGSGTLAVQRCLFSGNEGGFGGAITPQTIGGAVDVTVEDCVFKKNKGLNNSGAISYEFVNQPDQVSLRIRRCTFQANQALYTGGAISLGKNKCLVEDCFFDGNKTTFSLENYAPIGGGAVDGSGSDATFTNCLFSNNSAPYGGVVYASAADKATKLTFVNSTFVSNSATVSGGVFYNERDTRLNETDLTNCLLWQNTAPDVPVYKAKTSYSQLYATYSLIQGGYSGTGNLDTDPLFVNLGNGDYRLSAASPALDAGDPNPASLPSADLVGNPRVQNGRVDIGAYEFADPTVVFTLKDGAWSEPSSWSCYCLPGSGITTRIRHTIQIPNSYNAIANRVIVGVDGRLTFSSNARISFD